MRLCVNSQGERMDSDRIGPVADDLNVLTVIASESYENFSRSLQTEFAEAVSLRPKTVDPGLFEGRELHDEAGGTLKITRELALKINDDLVRKGYVAAGQYTDTYWQDRKNGALKLQADVAPYGAEMLAILDSVHDPNVLQPKNARDRNVILTLDRAKRDSEAFRRLWARINAKSAYTVKFSESELIDKAITALNTKLHTQKIYFTVQTGRLENIESREKLLSGTSFVQLKEKEQRSQAAAASCIKYDLLGKIVAETNLTRATVAAILKGIAPDIFSQYHDNPEDFIIKASHLINEAKATIIIQHITYNKLDATYAADIFTDPAMRGQLGKNAIRARKHLYDYVIYDSENERRFAEKLDRQDNEVEIYIKLPNKFYIPTPVGNYNPDWAIAFYEGKVMHIYFVAETKGSLDSLELRAMEKAKIACARKHFEAISSETVKYDVVNDYADLLNKVLI